jgi:gamma-glutamyltranspeptidase / glutathione hydrolase
VNTSNTVFIITFIFIFSFSSLVFAKKHEPVHSSNGMVVTSEKLAAQAGLNVLKNGGNAIDAAVTIGFVMAVTLPRAGNLGGGGFMLLRNAATKEIIALDYRETAPKKATATMFLNKEGLPDSDLSLNSYLAVGVPGTVSGLAYALETYGTISLSQALKPAIDLAEKGFIVSHDLATSLDKYKKALEKHASTKKVFFKNDGSTYKAGDLFIQPDLATSLKLIAQHGIKTFYQGELAEKIIEHIKLHGGVMEHIDLATYKPLVRKPIQGTYRDYTIYSMPPPSSGGVHLIQMLNMLEKYPLQKMGPTSPKTIHLLAETMRRAYADRSTHVGDPDFVTVPTQQLTSKLYAKKLTRTIKNNKASLSTTIKPGTIETLKEKHDTTHFSVMDKWGNVVSNTYTLNTSYGMKGVVAGTGILLNNEMDDFTSKPGFKNAYGLITNEKNKIEPNKRMLSSMAPTIVMKDSKPFLATGSPGGSRIITTVLHIISNVIDHKMDIATATYSPRIHHQWLPDVLNVEKGINTNTIQRLTKMGHTVQEMLPSGAANSIMFQDNTFFGLADPRRLDGTTLGF